MACSDLPVKAIDRMVASFGGDFSTQQSEPLESHESSQTSPKIANAREMLCELTGAGDAVVVNSHAAALLLAFGTLARHDRFDVLTTPGDLYETMSGYRIDDIFLQAGCEPSTVGSLTRATLDDYAAGATEETAFVYCADGIDGCLAVERSLPELSQLADFARKRNLPLVYDAEWSSFHATDEYGLKGVPVCRDCGHIVRPDVVLYEEMLDDQVLARSVEALSQADTLIVGGTSLVVYPAAGLIDYFQGDQLVLLNREPTPADRLATLVIQAPIGQTLAEFVDQPV
jgi:hypothetical protein